MHSDSFETGEDNYEQSIQRRNENYEGIEDEIIQPCDFDGFDVYQCYPIQTR